jgi:5'-phosphate synthase pdxT subunit
MRIGVLALQGGFIEHARMLESLQVETFEIRKKSDLASPVDGLVIPGGESTTMRKLLKELEMFDTLKNLIANGLPTFGTCAGMILLSKHAIDDENTHLGVIDIEVKRNAYGRQPGSFSTRAEFKGIGMIPMIFIRAPYIESTGENVEILSIVDDHIVAAREKNILVTSFHPELTTDSRVHQLFIDEVSTSMI